jgi:hypothetical protein
MGSGTGTGTGTGTIGFLKIAALAYCFTTTRPRTIAVAGGDVGDHVAVGVGELASEGHQGLPLLELLDRGGHGVGVDDLAGEIGDHRGAVLLLGGDREQAAGGVLTRPSRLAT